MTTEEVKQIIFNSKFDPGLKQRLVLLLPRLGKNTLAGLAKEVSRGDSLIIADYLVSLWESFASLLDDLKSRSQNSTENLSKFFAQNLTKFNGEDELYILNFVSDVRALINSNQARLNAEQYNQLMDYEVELFWQLPKEEILFLCQNNILYLLQKINLLRDTQVAVYLHDWDYADNFNKAFLDALYKNNEILGLNLQKTVGVWVKDFFDFVLPTGSQASRFAVAEFLSKNPSVQKLTKAEKESLSEILKLFTWFLDPVLDEKEVRDYKEQKQDQKDKQYYEQYITSQQFELPDSVLKNSSPVNRPQPPVIPAPRNAPQLRPINEIEPAVASDFAKASSDKKAMADKPAAPRAQAKAEIKLPPLNLPQVGVTPIKPILTKPVNIQEIINARRAEQTAVAKPSAIMQPKPAPDIDKKLEELEKRIKN